MPEAQPINSAATLKASTDSHREIFTCAIRNILQGCCRSNLWPGSQRFSPCRGRKGSMGRQECINFLDPLRDNHKTLCPGALERLRELRDHFDSETLLKFKSKVFTWKPFLSLIMPRSYSSSGLTFVPWRLAPWPLIPACSRWFLLQCTK